MLYSGLPLAAFPSHHWVPTLPQMAVMGRRGDGSGVSDGQFPQGSYIAITMARCPWIRSVSRHFYSPSTQKNRLTSKWSSMLLNKIQYRVNNCLRKGYGPEL